MPQHKVAIDEFMTVGEDNKPVKKYGIRFPHRRQKYLAPGVQGAEPPTAGDITLTIAERAYLFPTRQKAASWAKARGYDVVK